MNYQTVFITGATKGLGRALVIDLCSKGYRVVVHDLTFRPMVELE